MQNLAGLIVLMCTGGCKRQKFRFALRTEWHHFTGLSLGMFIFTGPDRTQRMARHEYGHSIQSLILGPLYLPLIGIPSVIWCCIPLAGRSWRSGRSSYYHFLPERWADRLGGVYEIRDGKKESPDDSSGRC